MKRPFIRKQKRKRHGATFWDHEYTHGEHLALSTDQSEDLEKFTRWQKRQKSDTGLAADTSVLDLGCGNGRNLIFLASQFGMKGIGYDISTAAIAQAKAASRNLPLSYEVRSIGSPLPIESETQTLVLDMMTSHFLKESERTQLRDEIHRILVSGGWLFMKTFLRDGDLHTERLLKTFPTKEEGTYRHPVMGMDEHVYSEEELITFLEEKFVVHKIYRSHKHVSQGKARKRRTISIYAQKDPYL